MHMLDCLRVVENDFVSGNEAHALDSALAELTKGAIRFPAIVLAMLLASPQ
jgi:hypothetical protein